MALLENASMPDVGSSRNTIFDYPINAIPNDNFRLDPPDNTLTNVFLSDSNSVVINKSSICLSILSIPLIPAINYKCSTTVNSSYRQSF